MSEIKEIDKNGEEKTATIYINKLDVDNETMKQIRKMITHPAIQDAKIMPDCHAGKGCCIGMTSKLNKKIVPTFIGGDIGCGICTYRCDLLTRKKKWEKIHAKIQATIPMGQEIYDQPYAKEFDLEEICRASQQDAVDFALAYRQKFDVRIDQYVPDYNLEWFAERCKTWDSNYQKDLRSLGTLGGGNHYIEINQGGDGTSYITVHSGSRNLGQKICRYHQDKITSNSRFDWDAYDAEVKRMSRNLHSVKEVKKMKDAVKEQIQAQRHQPYLEDEEAYSYYFDMIFAQNYARMNRRLMIRLILELFNMTYNNDNLIESIHNYIDFEDFIIRKGAIKADEGRLCVVSLNMRDGILLCRGRGNQDWNYSSAHGSGRVITRQKAFSSLSLKKYNDEMKGIISSVVRETIDESPMVYKDSEMIKELLGETIEIIEQLKPVINLKGLT